MNNMAFATIQELKIFLEKGDISHEELLDFFIKRAEKYKDLGAVIEIFDRESILDDFKSLGSLSAIPGLIKDNICQKGRIVSCGSKILQNFCSPYDATAIARLKQAGALLMGRSNMDEFAMGSSGETSAFGLTHNPWNTDCVPGGSSSGSAAAVAAGLVPWALGSDTGGSVRHPAGLCGIVGFKPTYGLISRYGLVAYGSSLDQIGVFSRSVYDNALVLSEIAGHDLKDSSSLRVEKKDYTNKLTGALREGLTIGVVEDALNAEGLNTEIRVALEQAITVFEEKGAKIIPVKLPALDYTAAAYFIISRAEAASNLARFDGVRYGLRAQDVKTLQEMYERTRHDGFGPEVKVRILTGNYVLSTGHADQFYDNAKRVQRVIRRQFEDIFNKVNVLLMPTNPIPAFKIGVFDDNKLEMDLQDYYTAAANLAGIPAISLPAGFTKKNLPIGLQLLASHLSEGLLYQTSYVYEQETQWHTRHPDLL